NSNTFKLGPAALGSFSWTAQPGASQKAGYVFTPSAISVTAFDVYSNVKYDQSAGAFSGLGGSSPQGCSGPCAPVYGFGWSDGVASSSTVEAFVTGQNEKLQVLDGSVSASSSQFDVGPDSLDHFEFALIANSHVAGGAFQVTATAYDRFENVKTNYPETGDAQVFSGLASSPSPSSHMPSYGAISWGN